jgi:hypothetical protein
LSEQINYIITLDIVEFMTALRAIFYNCKLELVVLEGDTFQIVQVHIGIGEIGATMIISLKILVDF